MGGWSPEAVEERSLEYSSYAMIHPSSIVQNACLTSSIFFLRADTGVDKDWDFHSSIPNRMAGGFD
jgi:hypothetical protein